MSEFQSSEHHSSNSRLQSNSAQDEGGCAQLFMMVLAFLSPILGIAFSIVYRAMGNKPMANRLLAISLVMLGLMFVFVIFIWGTAMQFLRLYLQSYPF